MGAEENLASKGVELIVLDDETCRLMMQDFIIGHEELWFEDIGKNS